MSKIAKELGLYKSTYENRSLRRRRNRRELKRITFSIEDGFIPSEAVNKVSNDIFIGATDIRDYKVSSWYQTTSVKRSISRKFNLLGNKQDWINFIENLPEDYEVYQFSRDTGLVITPIGYMDYNTYNNSIEVTVLGDENWVVALVDKIDSMFERVQSYIEWIYSPDGQSVKVPMERERLPIKEMYPFLNGKTLEEYYQNYIDSTANILLLIGPPGTGKTTFIRGLLDYAQTSATVTYDASILEKDYIFANFIENSTGIMVMEDCDKFLGSRSDGNTMMHKFLNVGDGLVTTKGKKLVFSTNLPSIRDVDPALIRPGRCFDIINFDLLTLDQAQNLAKNINVNIEEEKETYTIAEIFHKQSHNKTPRKVGFI